MRIKASRPQGIIKRLKRAFILAEVLITLAVIGVVSALAMPVSSTGRPRSTFQFPRPHGLILRVVGHSTPLLRVVLPRCVVSGDEPFNYLMSL